VLFLSDLDVLLFDIILKLFDVSFLVFQFVDQIVKLLLKELVLRLSVKVINADTRDLVGYVFNLDFLLGDLLIGNLGLLDKVCRLFLNSLLLRGMVEDIVTDGLGLGMQLHDGLL
jgi:hypothetical protein